MWTEDSGTHPLQAAWLYSCGTCAWSVLAREKDDCTCTGLGWSLASDAHRFGGVEGCGGGFNACPHEKMNQTGDSDATDERGGKSSRQERHAA